MMNVVFSCSCASPQDVACQIVMVSEQQWPGLADSLPRWSARGILQSVAADGEFSAKSEQVLLLHADAQPARLMLVGLGDETKITKGVYRAAASLAVQQLRQRHLNSWAFDLHLCCADTVVDVADCLFDGALIELYRFERYKTVHLDDAGSNAGDKEICCAFAGLADSALTTVQQRLAQRKIISDAVWMARNLVNEPGNVKTPAYLADTAWQLAQQQQMACTILGPAELERQGFGALLAVAKGSICEPRLIALEYHGTDAATPPIALVGKGVTFDSGGISLKPGEGMDQMKMDMAGGAAVLATIAAVSQLQLPINLIAVVPAVENMPSDRATRPGDIVTSLSGQTIEILNTDAEGRLILADALAWVAQKNPAAIIDLATLTGACILALGHHASAVLGTDDTLVRDLIQAGDSAGERLWQMPLFEDYANQLKSSVADMKNIGGRPAGTITAAAFLQKFVGETPWAHLDIAGTAWEEKGKPGQPSGATGFGVRLLVEYLQQR